MTQVSLLLKILECPCHYLTYSMETTIFFGVNSTHTNHEIPSSMLNIWPSDFARTNTQILSIILLACSILTSTLTEASPPQKKTTIAVASNFMQPMKTIVSAFEEKSGHKVRLVFGSSGKLFAQIRHNAPFDAFLSADTEKPEALTQSSEAVADSRFTYAIGTLLLWSADEHLDAKESLKMGQYRKLAIPNPRLAPYGAAAMEVIEKLQLNKETKPKLVMGENIAQTYQFVASRNAQIGFIALSQIMKDGKFATGGAWVIPDTLHRPIRQDAVLLKHGKDNIAAKELLDFMRSAAVTDIIHQYGYH